MADKEAVEQIAQELFGIWKEAKSGSEDNWDNVTFDSLSEKHKREYYKTTLRILGYIKSPELTVLSDEELNDAFDSAFDNPVDFDHEPTPDEIFTIKLRAVAQAQLEVSDGT